MESNFDIYLTGDILPGCRRGDAVAKLADLFNLETGMADQLLNGTRRRVKKSCNKASALQFRKILTEAGLQVAVERHSVTPRVNRTIDASALEGSAQEKAVFESKTPTMPSELIQNNPVETADTPVDYEPIDRVSARPSDEPYTVDVQVPLEVAPAGELLLDPNTDDTPSGPVGAFDLAPAGELIPTIKPVRQLLKPKTDHLQLRPTKDS